ADVHHWLVGSARPWGPCAGTFVGPSGGAGARLPFPVTCGGATVVSAAASVTGPGPGSGGAPPPDPVAVQPASSRTARGPAASRRAAALIPPGCPRAYHPARSSCRRLP